ncbi:MAG: hypothetical protein A2X49_15260 [Lentisphaerae bacterium GWF2_52_8]|nr:MAG: hypothetical protein A2X49_15260 [Lentisphaerae bacterium GWF2_52_8]
MIPEALIRLDDFRLLPGERLEAARVVASGMRSGLESAVCEIDLHCHSFYSDGYCSPAMRVCEAWRRGMRGIAIADHDVFDGQEEALAAGGIFGIDVVPAIEFYTDRPGIEIIGHFPDHDSFRAMFASGIWAEVVEPIREAKRKQLAGMISRIPACFARLGFSAEILPGDIDLYLRNGISTKGDISVLMWQKYGAGLSAAGIASDVKDFQLRYTTKDDRLNLHLELAMDLSPEAFVRRIRAWGGLPGLAHPTELRAKEKLDNAGLRSVISDLAAAGLQCIEIDGWRNGKCPETALPQTELFEQIRHEFNAAHPGQLPLLFSNGSDDHNQPGEGLQLGSGRNRNLRPEFGRYENLLALRQRQQILGLWKG